MKKTLLLLLSIKEKQELVENLHHLQSLKFSPVRPKAFTERLNRLENKI